MKRIIFVSLIILQAMACNMGSEKKPDVAKDDTVSVNAQTESTDEQRSKLLPAEVVTKHVFSNPEKEDVFKLRIEGNDPSNSIVHFTISNDKGELVYAEDFKVGLLLDESLLPANETLTEDDKIAALTKEINSFFREENFSMPAIGNDSDFREEYSDKAVWNDIKKDKSAVGFYYLLGGQNGRSIAWSKIQGKVVVYFNCC